MDKQNKIILGSALGLGVLVAIVIILKNRNASATQLSPLASSSDNMASAGSGLSTAISTLDAFKPTDWSSRTIVAGNKVPTSPLAVKQDFTTTPLPLIQSDDAAAFKTLEIAFADHGASNEKEMIKPFQAMYNAAIQNNDAGLLNDAIKKIGHLAAQGATNRGFNGKDINAFKQAQKDLEAGVNTKYSANIIVRLWVDHQL